MKRLLFAVLCLPIFQTSRAQVLLGLTSSGGTNDYGVIFSFDASNATYTKLKDLDYFDGVYPSGSLIQAKDGKCYGMTEGGGSGDGGVIFSFDPATRAYTVVKAFDNAAPASSLVLAKDGTLYGMLRFNGGFGSIFSFDPITNTYTPHKDFDGEDGSSPYGSLVLAKDGKLYGMTATGGSNDVGTLFSFAPATNTFAKLKDFSLADGVEPHGDVVQANDGKLYGMTAYGGTNNAGTLFSFDPETNTFTKLKDFNATEGKSPFGSLIQARDGKLYGMTSAGGISNAGVIFSFDPLTKIYSKLKELAYYGGTAPFGSLMQASDGKLCGMTSGGGNGFRGMIFSFDLLTGTYIVLKGFNYTDGSSPEYTSLIELSGAAATWYQDADGDGYGNKAVSVQAEIAPEGYVANNTDCNDNDPAVNPVAPEVCDGIDNNCNGQIDEGCNTETLTCPANISVITDMGVCNAVVNNIDPVVSSGIASITYSLSGATIGSGTGTASGQAFNKGVTTVTYALANDPSKSCSFTVIVEDKEAPVITNVSTSPSVLWPPNHKLQEITLEYNLWDNCGARASLSVKGNDGATSSDWQVVDAHHIWLRAERSGKGDGRTYTITITANDDAGNTSTQTIAVVVPHDMSNKWTKGKGREKGDLNVSVLPNPSQHDFTLQVNSNSDKPIYVRVSNAVGKLIEVIPNTGTKGNLRLGDNYRAGTYFAEVVQGNNRTVVKLVKLNE